MWQLFFGHEEKQEIPDQLQDWCEQSVGAGGAITFYNVLFLPRQRILEFVGESDNAKA